MINSNTIQNLVEIYIDDSEMLDIIFGALSAFEEYHSAIFNMETKIMVYRNTLDGEEYQNLVKKLDKNRTINHNSVLSSVNILNRLANSNALPMVYDGIVSEERPYRRDVANAVLEYIEQVIKNRR